MVFARRHELADHGVPRLPQCLHTGRGFPASPNRRSRQVSVLRAGEPKNHPPPTCDKGDQEHVANVALTQGKVLVACGLDPWGTAVSEASSCHPQLQGCHEHTVGHFGTGYPRDRGAHIVLLRAA